MFLGGIVIKSDSMTIVGHNRASTSSSVFHASKNRPLFNPFIVNSTTLPKYVYVVVVEYGGVMNTGAEIRGTYCTVVDANERVRELVHDEYRNIESLRESENTEGDGCITWSSDRTGMEAAQHISIGVIKSVLHAPASGTKQKWPRALNLQNHLSQNMKDRASEVRSLKPAYNAEGSNKASDRNNKALYDTSGQQPNTILID